MIIHENKDTKIIGYIKANEAKQTMFFLPENGFIATGKKGKANLSAKKISEYGLDKCL